ncbi:uncharacterized protein PHALS_02285 [Plasmopara halstedii]|uniref:Uncharacterized protein n=1 Tax=Plasmopara halstedii TaxID=4781 RepID=A0A0P1AYN6_PLAHL|nr:uncharacterized protein PHALS_02285 [Plasmopara halstedii]CEG45953.1 hypothetical protein PHALS_02285 [Plasmopara halstedii]|eukprot:XP_024582322.1 hypothetical protein PHALS_02285 [Plasmopara halstedii]
MTARRFVTARNMYSQYALRLRSVTKSKAIIQWNILHCHVGSNKQTRERTPMTNLMALKLSYTYFAMRLFLNMIKACDNRANIVACCAPGAILKLVVFISRYLVSSLYQRLSADE